MRRLSGGPFVAQKARGEVQYTKGFAPPPRGSPALLYDNYVLGPYYRLLDCKLDKIPFGVILHEEVLI